MFSGERRSFPPHNHPEKPGQKFSLGRFHVPDERPHMEFQRFCGQIGFDHILFDRTVEANLAKIKELLNIIPEGEHNLEKLCFHSQHPQNKSWRVN